LAQIEMSLSPVFESDGELAADDGDFVAFDLNHTGSRLIKGGRQDPLIQLKKNPLAGSTLIIHDRL
jgi:hypothetical protein